MKNLQKGFVLPLLVILIAVLGIGGGVYFQAYKKPGVIPVPTPGPADVSATQDEVRPEDYKVYMNSKHGFQFRYPTNWSVREENGPAVYVRVSDSDKNGNYLDMSTNDFIVTTIPDGDLVRLKDGVIRQIGVWQSTAQSSQFKMQYFPEKNMRILAVATDKNSQEIEDEMIASFKLVAASTEIPDVSWKTYGNDQFGFQFQYPADWSSPVVAVADSRLSVRFSEGVTVVAGSYVSPQTGKKLSINEIIGFIRSGAGTGSSKVENISVKGKVYSQVVYPTVNSSTGMYDSEMSTSVFIPLTSDTNFISVENSQNQVGSALYQRMLDSFTVN